MYVDYVYDFVKNEANGLDAIYEDFIIQIVGLIGLQSLRENKLIESCGVVNGRALYALCEKKG